MLKIDHLTKRFGGLAAVSDVSTVIEEGRINAIIGPNGAGKTTLFDLISGVTRADRGEVLLVVGAAGGVGSVLVQLALQLTGLTVVATASRPESRAWLQELGVQHVIDHHQPAGIRAQHAGDGHHHKPALILPGQDQAQVGQADRDVGGHVAAVEDTVQQRHRRDGAIRLELLHHGLRRARERAELEHLVQRRLALERHRLRGRTVERRGALCGATHEALGAFRARRTGRGVAADQLLEIGQVVEHIGRRGHQRQRQHTERQRRDGMCWRTEDERYNDGSAFRVVCRDLSGVIVTLFFGGPQPLVIGGNENLLSFLGPLSGTVWLLLKVLVFLYVYVWIRATLPRLRYDQLMNLGWKLMIPLALGWFMLLAAFRIGQDHGWNRAVVGVVCVVVLAAAAWLLQLATKVSARNREREGAMF